MKASLAGLIVLMIFISPKTHAQNFVYPAIKHFGAVAEVPFAVDKPDPTLDYKLVVEMKMKNENPGEIYNPLEHAARMYNLHVYGGVPQKNLHVAVVIFAFPIDIILNNDAYKKKHGVDNPNIKIIHEMKEAGIDIYACGQSIQNFGIDPATINPDVTVALSRFTTVSKLQMKGYAYFSY